MLPVKQAFRTGIFNRIGFNLLIWSGNRLPCRYFYQRCHGRLPSSLKVDMGAEARCKGGPTRSENAGGTFS